MTKDEVLVQLSGDLVDICRYRVSGSIWGMLIFFGGMVVGALMMLILNIIKAM